MYLKICKEVHEIILPYSRTDSTHISHIVACIITKTSSDKCRPRAVTLYNNLLMKKLNKINNSMLENPEHLHTYIPSNIFVMRYHRKTTNTIRLTGHRIFYFSIPLSFSILETRVNCKHQYKLVYYR